MKRKLQRLSRIRSSRLFQRNMLNRRLRRWWRATVVMPLAQMGENTRTRRRDRLAMLTELPWETAPMARAPKPKARRKKVWHRRRYTRARG